MGLIVPKHLARRQQPQGEVFRFPAIEVPEHLQEDLNMNKHLEPEFYKAVAEALNRSLNTPETALREVTEAALKERIQACYRTVIVLRYDLKYSLRKCFDLLPGRFVESLIRGERTEDTFEDTVTKNMWMKEGTAKTVTIDGDAVDHTEDGELNDDETPAS